jgi:predicted TIM-barrel fold metal-dependent hydrolase
MADTPVIVDCHVNIWNDEHLTPLYAQQIGRVRPGGAPGLKADADTLYAAMAAADKAIVFPLRYGDSAGIESDDETCAACVRKYPDKFVGFAYVDPRRPDYLDRLVHAVEDLGLRGVKFGPIYNGVALSDPRMRPVYQYCVKHDLPITLHMGTTFARNAPVELGRAILAEPVALEFPDLKMIFAHMGHPWYEETIVTVRKQPNLYCELSALFYRPWQFWNVMICAQEYNVTDKVFFGTDFPFSGVEESIAGLRNVNSVVEGTRMPRVSQELIERIIHSDPFSHWWHQPIEL